ncbi:tRNA pseudouridine synthase A [Alkaliphilus metalliredigens QYMF]|uniref:tRNA pseudouridine synthase A n=1 Tax=Alkaliphilus metalliredigens (strain QYMF) TaxID=293826 RepID=A6TWY7_ALKMQ|nr:tRNA pseudouridine(38-40) synthase TruA [Alkaliphilus metalliredigens]ABR50705.1 tRNA pseudouridine synthase A [Alkaliphilus metalliredigens QYMF]
MRNIRMIVEYDGTKYRGWQRQTATDMTIQGKLEHVISEMVGKKTEIVGSGRTDAGAHAYGQVANFHTKSTLSIKEMYQYINQYLPQDIVVKELKEAGPRFHSRYNVKGKKYVYRIWNESTASVFHRKHSYHVPQALNLELMQEAAAKLVGTYDFLPFSSVKKSEKTTVRTIESITIEKKDAFVEITIVGDGFLYNMVRIITGTLIEIGSKKKKPTYIDEIFSVGKRQNAGETVPSQGLFLIEVYYN